MLSASDPQSSIMTTEMTSANSMRPQMPYFRVSLGIVNVNPFCSPSPYLAFCSYRHSCRFAMSFSHRQGWVIVPTRMSCPQWRSCCGIPRYAIAAEPRVSLTRSHIQRHHTRGMKQEVCINYIQGLCQWNGKCHRIHPVDKTPFREILDKRPRNRRRVNLAQGPMFSNEPAYLSRPVQSGDNAHSVEPTNLSLTESPQLDSIFVSFSDQELRHGAGDATVGVCRN